MANDDQGPGDDAVVLPVDAPVAPEQLGPGEEPSGWPLGRRAFLGIVGVGVTSLLWGGAALDFASKSTKLLPQSVRGVVPFGEGWRIYAVNPPFPKFDPARWTLTIDGLVEEPQVFTYEQLKALPQTHQTKDFHCVTGWSVDQVPWTGVKMSDLLAIAKPKAGAVGINFVSMEEDYVDTLTLAQARLPDVMIAHSMYNQPIPRDHGAPARLVIPEMYGYKGVKWMSQITVVDKIEPGYWELRGYDTDAWIGNSNGLG
jgi:DMSO/TMAO reductase YedYZ molybdopterin-dependent catalytic subunit